MLQVNEQDRIATVNWVFQKKLLLLSTKIVIISQFRNIIKMSLESQASPQRMLSPTISRLSDSIKPKIYFTYQTSPQLCLQQSLKMIKEQEQQHRKRKIFDFKRKLSFEHPQPNKKRNQRLKIFDQPPRRIATLNSHIFLKQSAVSGAQSIVDQLDEFQQNQKSTNPINKKLSNLRSRQKTKRTFYSNTVKNSIMFNDNSFAPRRNRIQSQVLNYQYSPNLKNRSAVTIKASRQNKPYGVSKFSNRLSINTNQNLFSQFNDDQNVETPKYHKSSYKSVRKSFEASFMGDFDKKQKQLKNSSNLLEASIKTDRFYDESSMQTPRLPIVNKKVSYEVSDPLTNSLRKQKLDKKRLKQLQEQAYLMRKQSQDSRFQILKSFMLLCGNNLKTSMGVRFRSGHNKCLNLMKSETFFILIIVVLSLAIFLIQLFQ